MSRVYDRRPEEPVAWIRRGVQITFLFINVWIGLQFYNWVRYFETGGATQYFSRPPGVEGWLPIAAGHWRGHISEEIFFQLIPNASTYGHP